MGTIPPTSVIPEAQAGLDGLLGLLQLARRAREAGTLEELGFVATNETRMVLGYRQAALWLGGSGRQVLAVSGVPEVDPGAPYLQWLTRLFKALKPISDVTPVSMEDVPELIAEEWPSWLPAHVLCVPLTHPGLKMPGILLLAREQPWLDAERGLAVELESIFGQALFALRPKGRLPAHLGQALRQRRSWWRIALAVVLVSLIPVRLSALASADVAPVDPFVVRAPLDGVIDRLQVEPNQTVGVDAPLFDLDATTLQGQYDSARKAYETAREQYRQIAQQAVTDDKSRVELAERQGAMALKAIDLKYAAEQLSRVQIKAERAGVAVFDDVNDWTGKAVSVGEKVMVLADPSKVELTVYMPAGNQIALKPGADVTFYPQAEPFSSFPAKVKTVSYRAAPTDKGVLAYRVKAVFVAGQKLPRLGQSGTARLYADRVPLIYYVLRRPLATLRQWLGW